MENIETEKLQKKHYNVKVLLDYLQGNPAIPFPDTISTCYGDSQARGSTTQWTFTFRPGGTSLDWDTPEYKAEQRRMAHEWIAQIAKDALGTGVRIVKTFGNSYFTLELIDVDECFQLKYEVERDAICERVVTGKRIEPAHVIPEREVEEFEWVCNDKSLLDS